VRADLHVHLYGCLTAQDLWELAQKKQRTNWKRFETEWESQYGNTPDMAALTHPHTGNFSQFKKLFEISHPVSFPQFQAHFNLIIALVDLKNLNEVQELTQRIVVRHRTEGLHHVEYRMLFPPWMEQELFAAVTLSICKVLYDEEKSSNSAFQGRFSLGLPRTDTEAKHYKWLRELMSEQPIVAQITTSIDFCAIEEGFPPKSQAALIQKILSDNKKTPEFALAVLYHVAESFSDKSLESAIRWVHEVAELGAHRLGHAFALGMTPETYLNQVSTESVAERLDQIRYDLKHAEGLEQFGVCIDVSKLQQEQQSLTLHNLQEPLKQSYTSERIKELRCMQDYVMNYLKQMNVCVEVCPTSTLHIGKLKLPEEHSIFRFLNHDVPVIVGSDDPGIFDTTLSKEMEWVGKYLKDPSLLQHLKNNAQRYRSEFISGRKL